MSGQLPGFGVDLNGQHANGRFEALWWSQEHHGLLHEIRPDGQRRLGAFEFEVPVVVETDPDHAYEVGRETGEPSVARRSRLSGCGNPEATRPNASPSSA